MKRLKLTFVVMGNLAIALACSESRIVTPTAVPTSVPTATNTDHELSAESSIVDCIDQSFDAIILNRDTSEVIVVCPNQGTVELKSPASDSTVQTKWYRSTRGIILHLSDDPNFMVNQSGIYTLEMTSGDEVTTLSVAVQLGSDFVTKWITYNPFDDQSMITSQKKITLPLREDYNYYFFVDWGDGSDLSLIKSFDDPNRVHTYSEAAEYTVTIKGVLEAWYNLHDTCNTPDSTLMEVSDLGDMGWISLNSAFFGCFAMTSFVGGVTDQVTDMGSMFHKTNALIQVNLSMMDTSAVEDMSYMFYYMEEVTQLELSSFQTSKVTDMSSMFSNMKKLEQLDLSYFDTASVTIMSDMFSYTTALRQLSFPKSFDTKNVTSMHGMFSNMANLVELDVTNFNTEKVVNMGTMFSNLPVLESLDLTSFRTPELTSMSAMFRSSHSLKSLAIPNFDTQKVKSMNSLFVHTGLESIDLSHFVTTQLDDLRFAFYSTNLKFLNINGWNLNAIKNANNIFEPDSMIAVTCDQSSGIFFGLPCL